MEREENGMAKLVKIDRNGSKHFEGYRPCPRCGGSGVFYVGTNNGALVPAMPANGMCYKCEGTGKVWGTWVERTPEYEAKLAARREARANARAAEARDARRAAAGEANEKFLTRWGFNSDGKAWAVVGDTFEIKDELKEAGAKYNNIMGWCFNAEPTFDAVEIHADAIMDKDADGWYSMKSDAAEIVRAAKNAAMPESRSEYVGEVGGNVAADVKCVAGFGFNTAYGSMEIYKFKDAAGNVFTWKTGSVPMVRKGERYKVRGTVKDHEEYKGEKQTVLTRCKIEEA